MTHLDLFSGIGGFAIAAQACGYTTIGFCEREPYAQAVLRKHWPEVPIHNDIKTLIQRLTGMPSDEYIARYVTPAITKIRPSSSDVSIGPVHSRCCDLFPSHPAGDVGYHAPQGCEVPTQHTERNGEPFRERDESGGQGAEHSGKSRGEGDHRTASGVREVRSAQSPFQEWTDGDSGTSFRLRQAARSDVALPAMPSQMAQEQQSERLKLGEISILTAGVPCQPASVAGNQRGTDDARWLWPETFAVIHATYPTWVLLENVPGLLALEQEVAFEHLCLTLESFGYEVQPLVIPACAVDARHRRDRVWIVAHAASKQNNRERGDSERGRDAVGRHEQAARRRNGQADNDGTGGQGQDVAHADSQRGCVRQVHGEDASDAWESSRPRQRQNAGQLESTVCGMADGIPEGMDSGGGFCQWPEEDHETPRVTTGMKHRAHRLKALGNSIVSQVAEKIIRAIASLG